MWVEVQIRTHRMDDIAEKGIAAHWMYKRNGFVGEGDNEMDLWLTRIKEILVNPDVNALELLDIIHNDLTSAEIYVFTPRGEQRTIQKGATVLDFAYLIHTEIGNKAIAAKVNQKLVSLNHVIKTGDKIEIITAEEAKPQPEWLQFLVTHRARTLVQDYFKTQRRQVLDSGRSILEDRVQQLGFTLDETTLQRIEVAYHSESRDELFYNIGLGNQSLENLEEVLKKSSGTRISWLRRVIGSSDPDSPRFSIATCCNPIPGDPVIGFKAPDGVVTVHKKSCRVAERIAASHGDWVVVPKWLDQAEDRSFLVRISLKGIDRMGLLNEISRYVSLVMGVNMRKLSLQAEGGIFDGFIDLYVPTRETLEEMIKNLQAIDGIENVTRTEI